MNKTLILALILCTAVLSQGNNCPGYYGGDLLQSGKNAIMKSKSTSNHEYTYEAPINFPIPFNGLQIAVTTATIGDYNPLPNYGYNYFIEAARKDDSNYIIYKLIMNNDNSWTSMQLSYLVSGRPDMVIGNYESPINQWTPATANVYTINYAVKKDLPQGNYRVAAFISGFSTTDNQFSLTINRKSFDLYSRKLSVSFYCSANPAVLTLTISYIIYPQFQPIFEITYDLTPRGQVGSYQIAGPVNFQPNKRIEYNQWRVQNRYLVCTGNQCSGSCILRERCAQMGGNIWEGQCIFCAPGIIFQYGRCSRKCGLNQIYVNRVCACAKGFVRRGKDCVKQNGCGANQIYSDSVRRCVCKPDFYYSGSDCVTCPNGAVATPDGKSCVCRAPDQLYNPATNSCSSRCIDNQQWFSDRCQCVNGFSWWSQNCRKCPGNADPTADQSTCACRSQNAYYNPQTNACIQCGRNSRLTVNRDDCICIKGYILKNGVCTITCRDDQYLDQATGACQCNNGMVRGSGGFCGPRCNNGDVWNGVQCVCPDGTARYGNCKQCPVGSYPNVLRTSCICADPNQILLNFQCVTCPRNSKPNYDLTQCVCNNGYKRIGNNCVVDCGLNEQPSQFTQGCECIFGYERFNNGNCQYRCAQNQQWNGKQCICRPGFGLYNNVCTQCPSDATPNPFRTSCLCIAPNYIFNQRTFSCQACQDYSYNTDDDTRCLCNPGYELIDGFCSPICQLNEQLNKLTNKCQCAYGFIRLGPQCTERCGINQQWTGTSCICRAGYVKARGSVGPCKPCPQGYTTNPKRTTCLCTDNKFLFDLDRFACNPLPANAQPVDDFYDFTCYKGYTKNGWDCSNPCPQGAAPDMNGQCICGSGLMLQNGVCRKPNSCPGGSLWDQDRLQCVCRNRGQFLIDRQCRTCGQNSVYQSSTKQCVCSTGFFSIGGVCQICDARTKYNGTDCICNLGYYGTRDQCFKCHQTCSQCTGPQANQCLSCSDVSLVLQNGFCIKNNPCQPGFFLNQTSCTKCADFCISCDNVFECSVCAVGHKVEKVQIGDQVVHVCNQICGDGIKYQAECDDGNTIDGDGCSSECTIQSAWSCQGGSSAQKSKCHKYIPDQSVFTSKGIVNLGDRVIQSVRASYLPKCMTDNQCSKCFKAIKVNVVDANVPILVTVSYIPFSQYQFLVQYNFQGLIVTSKFKTVIKLSDEFKGCFVDEDYNQQLEIEVDPAFLAKIDTDDELALDQVDPKARKIPTVVVPQSAKKFLGLPK